MILGCDHLQSQVKCSDRVWTAQQLRTILRVYFPLDHANKVDWEAGMKQMLLSAVVTSLWCSQSSLFLAESHLQLLFGVDVLADLDICATGRNRRVRLQNTAFYETDEEDEAAEGILLCLC